MLAASQIGSVPPSPAAAAAASTTARPADDSAVDPIGAHARQYLEDAVVPVLIQGLKNLVRERPDNPVDYLALYLLKHNPRQPNIGVEVPVRPTQA